MTALDVSPPASSAPAQPRYVSVVANLLPEEIAAAREGARMQRRVLAALVGLVAVLVALYVFSTMQTSRARSALSAVQAQSTQLQQRLLTYQPLVQAQERLAGIDQQLATLMGADVPWRDVLATLDRHAPPGTTLTSVTAVVTQGVPGAVPAMAPATDPLNTSGTQSIGTLTISGTTRDKASVANYLTALGKLPQLAAPLLTGTTTQTGSTTFNITADLTPRALGGRFSASSSGGGN
jgi:Tfp pilus assembly protein PilN